MEATYLAVARFRKPHGLKGDVIVYPMTDEPEAVLVPGRVVRMVNENGLPVGSELVIARARSYQRYWLLGFEGITTRWAFDEWRDVLLAAREDELRPLGEDEMYLHDIPGATVLEDGVQIGIATGVLGVPGGHVLAFERDGREHLVPFREPHLVRLNRRDRTIEMKLPAGLLEL